MSSTDLSTPPHSRWESFSDVDASGDAGALGGYLDDITSIPGVATSKRHSLDRLSLRAGDHVLDIGCGTGPELGPLAELVGPGGRVVGIDRSAALVAEADLRHRQSAAPLKLVVGDAEALPFPDGAFHACRADRTLQHLEHPDLALAEMARVVRSGGRVVVTESRWGLDAPDLDETVTSQVLQVLSTDSRRRDWLGYLLPLMLRLAGLTDVSIASDLHQVCELRNIAGLMNLEWSVNEVVRTGTLSRSAADDWREQLQALVINGRASIQMLIVHVSGAKP